MKTLDEIKSIGFKGNNFIRTLLPSFFYDPVHKLIIGNEEQLEQSDQFKLIPCVVKTHCFELSLADNEKFEIFHKINNSNLVAWYPIDDYYDFNGVCVTKLLRFCILED